MSREGGLEHPEHSAKALLVFVFPGGAGAALAQEEHWEKQVLLSLLGFFFCYPCATPREFHSPPFPASSSYQAQDFYQAPAAACVELQTLSEPVQLNLVKPAPNLMCCWSGSLSSLCLSSACRPEFQSLLCLSLTSSSSSRTFPFLKLHLELGDFSMRSLGAGAASRVWQSLRSIR